MAKEVKIGCTNSDPDLFRVMTVCKEFLTQKEKTFEIEEMRVSASFIYFVKVKETNLEGYIGRRPDTSKIVYMIIDSGRLNWAMQEGFTRVQAFEKVGVFREAMSIDSFIKWITGEKNYKLKEVFIKSLD
jgi:hypothetical protein